jgi:hypothetical protein
MVKEGLKIFPDGNFHFYHDALLLLTAKGTKAEMEKRGMLKYWILPEGGLNKGTPYALRPPGNCPELISNQNICMWVTPKEWFATASSANHNSVATIFGL